MSIVFFGTSDFAVPFLKTLIDSKEKISLVITRKDKKQSRGHILTPPPIKNISIENNINVIQPLNIKENSFYDIIKGAYPDFIIVVSYGKILPREILTIPRYGCINVHASLLPRYRGAAPIQWALINGEETTGVTIMLMNEGLDTGDILTQSKIKILDDDNVQTLSKRLSLLGPESLIEILEGLRTGNIKPIPQGVDKISYAPLLKKEDGRINWNKGAKEISDFIRGVTPWPSAFCYLKKKRIKIIKARPIDIQSIAGRIEKYSDGQIIIGTGKDALLIEQIQPEGKRIMMPSEFIAGRRIEEKDCWFS